MKYSLYTKRLDDLGHDATSTLTLEVERDSPPTRLSDFVGGNGRRYNGYAAHDQPFDIETDQDLRAVSLVDAGREKGAQLFSGKDPLAIDQQLRLENDNCEYKITHSSWWSPPARPRI